MNRSILIAAVIISVICIAVVGLAIAASSYWVNGTNSVSGIPLLAAASPTPTPTPTSTSTPTEPQIISAYLTANDTLDGEYIFFRGNTLHLVALLNVTVVTDVQLYNNDVLITTAQSDAAGIATFDRVVNNPYNYTVKVWNP